MLELYRLFYSEARYQDCLEYDEDKVRDTIFAGIITDDRPHILAVVDESIVGFISWWLDRTFSKQPCMVGLEFYVLPDFRGSAIGRGLLGLAITEGKRAGAGACHFPLASGMRELKTMVNMFQKAGFQPLGVVMRRKL